MVAKEAGIGTQAPAVAHSPAFDQPRGVAEGGREIVELPRLTVMEHCCATA
jgi:hypothetical protein